MPEPSAIRAVIAGVNPVSGEDVITIEYDDGETVGQPGKWVEGRELAERAGLEQREDGPGFTRWTRRGLYLVALVRLPRHRVLHAPSTP